MITIESPVKGYTGISAGVGFAIGKALVKELTPTQEEYFRKKGYTIKKEQENEIKHEFVTKADTLQTRIEENNNNLNATSLNYGNLGDID